MLYEALGFLCGWLLGVYNGRETIYNTVTGLPSSWLTNLIVVYGHGRSLAARWQAWKARWSLGGMAEGHDVVRARIQWRQVHGFWRENGEIKMQLLAEFDDEQAERVEDLGPWLQTWRAQEGTGKPLEGFIINYQWLLKGPENEGKGRELLEGRQRYFLVTSGEMASLRADGSWLEEGLCCDYSEIDTNLPPIIEAHELWQRLNVWAGPNGQFGQELPGWTASLLTTAIQIVNGPNSPYPFYRQEEAFLQNGEWIKLSDPLLERVIGLYGDSANGVGSVDGIGSVGAIDAVGSIGGAGSVDGSDDDDSDDGDRQQ